VVRPTPGAVAAITSSSILKFNRRTFFSCAAELCFAVFSQLERLLVFDLATAHLHRLIALHIITKFLA
jgi:hypothetical protein